MDSNSCRHAQNGTPPPMDAADWRSHIMPESRERIANKIMEAFKGHLPHSCDEDLQDIKQIAIRFEENIFVDASSTSDYLRKLSLKLLALKSKNQDSLHNAIPSNSSGTNRNTQDSGATSSKGASGKMSMEELFERASKKKKLTDPSDVQIHEVKPNIVRPPPPKFQKGAFTRSSSSQSRDLSITLPEDFLAETTNSSSIWPSAEKLLVPAAKKRLEKMTPAEVMSEVVNLQLHVQNQSQSVSHQMASYQFQAQQQILAQNMQNNVG